MTYPDRYIVRGRETERGRKGEGGRRRGRGYREGGRGREVHCIVHPPNKVTHENYIIYIYIIMYTCTVDSKRMLTKSF